MKLEITCNCTTVRNIGDLKPMQGGIKTLPKKNRRKLKDSFEKHGFNVPFIIWGDKIIDGHQRRIVLMEDLNYTGVVPVVEIEAESEEDAKKKLLHITGMYGRFDIEGLEEFSANLDGLDSVCLVDGPDIDMDFTVEIESAPVSTSDTDMIDDIELVDQDEYKSAELGDCKENDLKQFQEIVFPDNTKLVVGEDRYFAGEVVRMWNNRNRTQQVEL